MSEELPVFKYHPDPIKTGAIVPSDMVCVCCGKTRGYVEAQSAYEEDGSEAVCPWCIADGSAAKKQKGGIPLYSGGDTSLLKEAGVPQEVIMEIQERTPGYEAWQGDIWLAHCSDACEFHGDASKEDLKKLTWEEARAVVPTLDLEEIIPEKEWSDFQDFYEPKGQPAFYKFICRHCGKTLYHVDFT